MKDVILYEIIKTYNELLEKKFGDAKLEIDIIHDDRDLVIRCWEREILYSILKYHENKFKIGGVYKESLLGKVVLFNIDAIKTIYKTIEFDNIYKFYKEQFIKRINKIIKKYDIISNIKNNEVYRILVLDYNDTIKQHDVNITLYYQLRERFEHIRDDFN